MGQICAPLALDSTRYPRPSFISNPTPFRLLFARDARTQLDAITPVIDGVECKGGLDACVSDKRQAFREVCKALGKRQAAKDQSSEIIMTA